MSFLAQNILAAGRPQRSQIVETTVIIAPTGFDAPMTVAEVFNPAVQWQITKWSAVHGNTLPAVGATALIILTDRGSRVCVWWSGTHS